MLLSVFAARFVARLAFFYRQARPDSSGLWLETGRSSGGFVLAYTERGGSIYTGHLLIYRRSNLKLLDNNVHVALVSHICLYTTLDTFFSDTK